MQLSWSSRHTSRQSNYQMEIIRKQVKQSRTASMKRTTRNVRTHQSFRSQPGAGSNESPEVPDPRHRRSWRDLPLRGVVAFAITGTTVHSWAITAGALNVRQTSPIWNKFRLKKPLSRRRGSSEETLAPIEPQVGRRWFAESDEWSRLCVFCIYGLLILFPLIYSPLTHLSRSVILY